MLSQAHDAKKFAISWGPLQQQHPNNDTIKKNAKPAQNRFRCLSYYVYSQHSPKLALSSSLYDLLLPWTPSHYCCFFSGSFSLFLPRVLSVRTLTLVTVCRSEIYPHHRLCFGVCLHVSGKSGSGVS